MHRKTLIGLILLGLAAAPLAAQTPKPAPSPTPKPAPQPKIQFDRAYTEAQLKELQKARARYAELCKTSKDLKQLDLAEWYTRSTAGMLQFAAEMESWNNDRAVREARDDRDLAYQAEIRMEIKKNDPHAAVDTVAEIKAREALDKANLNLHNVHQAAAAKIVAAVDPEGGKASDLCPEHQVLRKAREEAKRAEAAKKQQAAAAPAKATDDCNRGGGPTGALEKLACQEGKK